MSGKVTEGVTDFIGFVQLRTQTPIEPRWPLVRVMADLYL